MRPPTVLREIWALGTARKRRRGFHPTGAGVWLGGVYLENRRRAAGALSPAWLWTAGRLSPGT